MLPWIFPLWIAGTCIGSAVVMAFARRRATRIDAWWVYMWATTGMLVISLMITDWYGAALAAAGLGLAFGLKKRLWEGPPP